MKTVDEIAVKENRSFQLKYETEAAIYTDWLRIITSWFLNLLQVCHAITSIYILNVKGLFPKPFEIYAIMG